MKKSWQLPRRTFLKGAGASILLPMLEVMAPTEALAQSQIGPRYAAMFLPSGVWGGGVDYSRNDRGRYNNANPWQDNNDRGNGLPGGGNAWKPVNTGPLNQLPLILQVLESVKDKFSVISGLSSLPSASRNGGIQHSLANAAWLTGAWNDASDARNNGSLSPPNSIDQEIANWLGFTPGSTIVFNPNDNGGDGGGSQSDGGYLGAISFNKKIPGNHLVPQSGNPREIFKRLFGNCENKKTGPSPAQQEEKKILDQVMDSIKDVQKNLGKEDTVRLQSFLSYVEELEQRISQLPDSGSQCPEELPALGNDWFNTVNAMTDVVALALATDAMPVATLMQGSEVYRNYYSDFINTHTNFIGVYGKKVNWPGRTHHIHFDVCHLASGGRTELVEQYIAYNQMQLLFTKRLIEKMNSMPVEPNGLTPLDNSMIMVGACQSHGLTHMVHDLPTLLVGAKKYKLRQGQHIRVKNFTHVGHFHYTLLKQLGWPGNNFNGKNQYLSGIFG